MNKTDYSETEDELRTEPSAAGKNPGQSKIQVVDKDGEMQFMQSLAIIYKYKIAVLACMFAGLLVGIYFAKTRPYISEVLVVPNRQVLLKQGGSLQKLEGLASMLGAGGFGAGSQDADIPLYFTIMQTTPFFEYTLDKYNLMPTIQQVMAEAGNKKPVTREDAVNFLRGLIVTKEKPGSPLLVGAVHRRQRVAAAFSEIFVKAINSYGQTRAISNASAAKAALLERLEKTQVIEMKTMLYSLITERERDLVIAETQPDYVFKILDVYEPRKHGAATKIILGSFTLIGLVVGAVGVIIKETLL